jgi:hypothetical protein
MLPVTTNGGDLLLFDEESRRVTVLLKGDCDIARRFGCYGESRTSLLEAGGVCPRSEARSDEGERRHPWVA